MICWCGNKELMVFSDSYKICEKCNTLVSVEGLKSEDIVVKDDERDFYGKNYWDKHQKDELGQPDVYVRTRADLVDRCIHWLRFTLKYKLPPAKVLELGCAHGGFVALLKQAGFEATGLELSPHIVAYARDNFNVTVLCGPIENHDVAPASLDIIFLMDVIEHLSDPFATMDHCFRLLKPDGIVVVQCPRYPEGVSYEDMLAQDDPFLKQLKADEHLYLFSRRSIKEFFARLGAEYLEFEPAIFSLYDMFMVVSRRPFKKHLVGEIENSLTALSTGRFVLAILDLADQRDLLKNQLEVVEVDRAARLELIHKLSHQLAEIEDDRAARLNIINKLSLQLKQMN